MTVDAITSLRVKRWARGSLSAIACAVLAHTAGCDLGATEEQGPGEQVGSGTQESLSRLERPFSPTDPNCGPDKPVTFTGRLTAPGNPNQGVPNITVHVTASFTGRFGLPGSRTESGVSDANGDVTVVVMVPCDARDISLSINVVPPPAPAPPGCLPLPDGSVICSAAPLAPPDAIDLASEQLATLGEEEPVTNAPVEERPADAIGDEPTADPPPADAGL